MPSSAARTSRRFSRVRSNGSVRDGGQRWAEPSLSSVLAPLTARGRLLKPGSPGAEVGQPGLAENSPRPPRSTWACFCQSSGYPVNAAADLIARIAHRLQAEGEALGIAVRAPRADLKSRGLHRGTGMNAESSGSTTLTSARFCSVSYCLRATGRSRVVVYGITSSHETASGSLPRDSRRGT